MKPNESTLSFSTRIPGGFQDCTLSPSRRIDRDWPDIAIYDEINCFEWGQRPSWLDEVDE